MVPPHTDLFDAEREGLGELSSQAAGDKEEPNAIYTCKFPGCERQYASTDGVRKHCRKSHPDWLREVDLEKAALGCRWAAYCTRQVIEEGGPDPRTTPAGSKRAREIMAAGNAAYEGAFSSVHMEGSSSEVQKTHAQSSEPSKAAPAPKEFGDLGTLVPPTRPERASSSENVVPPDMVAVPGADCSTPAPTDAKLTPNAQARQRVRTLGEIADQEGPTLQSNVAGGFFAWGMPPLKRGLSLADTRESTVTASGGSAAVHDAKDDESTGPPSRQEAFLDSIIA